jgi:hypothetical protein
VGAVFFPLVSIGFAFDVYLDGRYDPKKSVNERALEVMQAFLIYGFKALIIGKSLFL